MTRNLIAVGGCLSLFCAGWIFGQTEGGVTEGTLWKTASDVEQIMYVKGFTDGYLQRGLDDDWINDAKTLPRQAKLTPGQEADISLAALAQKHVAGMSSGASINEVRNTMSTLYSDFRNAPICWRDAFMLSVASLAGRAPTEQELDLARKVGAEHGCK